MPRAWCASRAATTPATRWSSSGHKTALQLVPSGVMRDGVPCYIGNGVVVDPAHLLLEIERLEAAGLDVRSRLFVSESCPLILPFHVAVDLAREGLRESSGAGKIGTTGKGIGPAYEDKVARRALRAQDLKHPERFARKLRELVDLHNFALGGYLQVQAAGLPADPRRIDARRPNRSVRCWPTSATRCTRPTWPAPTCCSKARRARCSTSTTAPIRTSRRATAWPATPRPARASGPDMLHYVLGITKAYTTRVGSGPFPTELPMDVPGSVGHHLSTVGQERGTVTGRARRCGWLDAAALKRSTIINGLSGLCITKLDVLDGLSEIKACIGYKLGGRTIDVLPLDADEVAACEPIYESFPGWTEKTAGLTEWDQLPLNARRYLERVQALIGTPIDMVSTGPDREHTILLRHPYQG